MKVMEEEMGKLKVLPHRRNNSTDNLVFHRISKKKGPS